MTKVVDIPKTKCTRLHQGDVHLLKQSRSPGRAQFHTKNLHSFEESVSVTFRGGF